jgi:uncharacterized Zn finger protein
VARRELRTFEYVPRSVPRRVDGGIRARSQRGEIGESWWSRRFIEILESHEYGARLRRGRSYARSGQVLELEVTAGMVLARVQGSRPRPYRVELAVKTLSDRDWERAERAMAERAVFVAKLLAGEMPKDIEEAFTASKLTLFPGSGRELSSSCTCPDWASTCKHVAAVFYLLAEAFDEDPFLIFQWRGRTRNELMTHLRSLRSSGPADGRGSDGAAPSADRPLRECLAAYWRPRPELADVHSRPWAAGSAPDALVRRLGPAGISVRGEDLGDVIARAYQIISQGAEKLALAEQEPADGPAG